MRHVSWNAFMKYSAIALLTFSLLAPLYFFPTLDDARGVSVRAWEAVQGEPLIGVAFLVSLLTPILLGRPMNRPWKWVVLACAPLFLVGSAMVVYLVSALSFSSVQMPFPVFPLPFLLTGSSVGLGCWAFVTANALLLVLWGKALRKHGWTRFHISQAKPDRS